MMPETGAPMTNDLLNPNAFEQQFRDLLHEAPFSAALLSGEKFVVEMANAISLQLWGKDKRIIGKPLLEAIPEIKDQKVYEILERVFRTDEVFEGKEHVAYLEKEGVLTQLFVNLVYKPIKNSKGRITGILAVGYDVTDQVVARKKLQESETRARVAIESTGLGTFEWNYKTGEVKSSSQFDQIFGLDSESPHSEYVSRIHPEDLEARNAAHRDALRSGKLEYDARIVLPDQTLRWVKFSGSVIFERMNPREC